MARKILIELSEKPEPGEHYSVSLIDTKECRTIRRTDPARFETALGIAVLWITNSELTL